MPPVKKTPVAVAKPPAPPEVDIDDDEEDPDDGEDEEDEQFGVPQSLMEAAGIVSDEDWDALEPIDIEALKARNAAKKAR